MNFGGKKYDTKLTRAENKKKEYMHDMHKLSMGVTFTQMTDKKGIKRHGDIVVSVVYK